MNRLIALACRTTVKNNSISFMTGAIFFKSSIDSCNWVRGPYFCSAGLSGTLRLIGAKTRELAVVFYVRRPRVVKAFQE